MLMYGSEWCNTPNTDQDHVWYKQDSRFQENDFHLLERKKQHKLTSKDDQDNSFSGNPGASQGYGQQVILLFHHPILLY